jgi:hypothetical protein
MKLSGRFLPSLLLALSGLALSPLIDKQSSDAQEANGRFINSLLSGKCIDVAGGPGRSNGAPLQLWDCELTGVNPDNNSTTDQRWVLTKGGFIRNTLSGKCIDVGGAPGQSNSAPLQLWDCEFSGRNRDNGSNTDQQWTFAN